MIMFGLVHRNVGRVAPTNFVEVMSRMRCRAPYVRSSETPAARSYRGMTRTREIDARDYGSTRWPCSTPYVYTNTT